MIKRKRSEVSISAPSGFETMSSYLNGKTYNAEEAKHWTLELCNEIKVAVKGTIKEDQTNKKRGFMGVNSRLGS